MSPPKCAAKRLGIGEELHRTGTVRLKGVRWDDRRGTRAHARHSAFVGSRNDSSELGMYTPGIGHDAQTIVDQVKALEPDRLRNRYHELVDKRLLGALDFAELFELERIDARLDAEDQDEEACLTVVQDDWQRERSELVASIERLLARFKAAG